ncbi:hypothetical protein D3C71_1811510 [compost metagenome]
MQLAVMALADQQAQGSYGNVDALVVGHHRADQAEALPLLVELYSQDFLNVRPGGKGYIHVRCRSGQAGAWVECLERSSGDVYAGLRSGYGPPDSQGKQRRIQSCIELLVMGQGGQWVADQFDGKLLAKPSGDPDGHD